MYIFILQGVSFIVSLSRAFATRYFGGGRLSMKQSGRAQGQNIRNCQYYGETLLTNLLFLVV
jgi:hypothetical protein